jgi:hypothetical protein
VAAEGARQSSKRILWKSFQSLLSTKKVQAITRLLLPSPLVLVAGAEGSKWL